MKEMDSNHASGSECCSPHPCRDGNERVFLLGWIWSSSRYPQSWSSLHLPAIEALLSYGKIREGSVETQRPRVPECIVMAQSPWFNLLKSQSLIWIKCWGFYDTCVNGLSQCLHEYKVSLGYLDVIFCVYSLAFLPESSELGKPQFTASSQPNPSMTIFKGDPGCLWKCCLHCLRL